ncbi:MAG: Hcp family type VI secretion system effector [Sphingomonadales bacterium]
MSVERVGTAGLIALAAMLAVAAPAGAASDIYLKIEGIPGESADMANRGAIEVASWSLGATQSAGPRFGGAAGAGRTGASAQPAEPPQGPATLSLAKAYDKSSPKLAEACAKGTHFPKATLSVRKSGGGQQDYMTYELENVMISSYSVSGGGGGAGGGQPMESLSLNYTKIQFKTPPDGGAKSGAPGKTGYDVAPAKKI